MSFFELGANLLDSSSMPSCPSFSSFFYFSNMAIFQSQMIYQQNYKNIQIAAMKIRSQSVGVINLQKQIQNQQQTNKAEQFIPFINERKLGKLILNTNENIDTKKNKKESIDEINFKNFKKIYNRERIIENARYSRLTRNSAQPDLISSRPDWTINQVSSLTSFKTKRDLTNQRPCCHKSKPLVQRKIQKFDKIDQDIYKKIAVSKPSENMRNPQIHSFFRHYVQACEMNENIRRLDLITKKKF